MTSTTITRREARPLTPRLPERAPDIDTLVSEGKAAAMSGLPVAEVARTLWARERSLALADLVAPKGLAALIHTALALHRDGTTTEETNGVGALDATANHLGPVSSPRGLGASRAQRPRVITWSGVLAGNYEAADGTRKALFAFTHDDAAHLAVISRAREAGNRKLADAMDLAARSLPAGGSKTIADLNIATRRRIELVLA